MGNGLKRFWIVSVTSIGHTYVGLEELNKSYADIVIFGHSFAMAYGEGQAGDTI